MFPDRNNNQNFKKQIQVVLNWSYLLKNKRSIYCMYCAEGAEPSAQYIQ